MKKILFVVNTLGRAGAETALLELLRRLDSSEYEVSLYVILAQGEMIGELPSHVKLKNRRFNSQSVMTGKGKRAIAVTICSSFFRNGGYPGKIHSIVSNFADMERTGKIQTEKLLWRMLSDGAERLNEVFDLAVAYLEGASAYYVADHVKARHKVGFIHIDYRSAGYTRRMDRDCFRSFDRIFGVSDEVREHFLLVYPEYATKTKVFYNMIDQERIRRRAQERGGFADGYRGARILTVGRLTYQKAYDIAIEAMKLVKDAGFDARWYVLGEGDQRRQLMKKIASLSLQEEFVLLGAVTNPYPYYMQADLYVHATRYEGKSIAIQEAQTLGCAVIASDRNGNREQITDGQDGILCELTPRAIAKSIMELLQDKEKRKALRRAAAKKDMTQPQGLRMLLELV
ncbi:MAG: glycosyltransferase [Dorea sp.]|jgi:glycosyltransferase involved in cell wall biosynthesis|nr:glycosyltransferase [Dorea sp.]